MARLPRVAVLVSILSPRYVKSEWCLRELSEFLRATAGARVADKLRVFKVVKTPVLRDQIPPALVPILGYEFFTVDPHNGRERELEFNPALATPEQRRMYLLKLDDLAHDIADLLARLERDTPVRPVAQGNAPPRIVYVAETSADANDRRDTIRRELQARGHTVLPDRPLPLVADECAAYVRDQLARSCLSVHVVGRNYGLVPDGAKESIVVLQNDLAIERAPAGDFCRLIWMPPDITIEDPRQQQFIERLESDPRNDAGTDVLKTAIEDFKTVLYVRLNPPRPTPAVATAESSVGGNAADAIKRVYVICDRRDIDNTRPLEDFLFSRHCEVILPVFEGDEAQIRQEHETNLIECDAAVIYYGAGNELWLRGRLRELQKIAGYGRTKPLVAKAVYVAPPATPEKDRFRTLEALVIAAGDTGPAALEPLLATLTPASIEPVNHVPPRSDERR